MLIDNLKDINSISDLFQYICNIESELEQCKKLNTALRVMKGKMTSRILELQDELEALKKEKHLETHPLLIQLDKKLTKPEVGFKRDFKDYNINVRKREL